MCTYFYERCRELFSERFSNATVGIYITGRLPPRCGFVLRGNELVSVSVWVFYHIIPVGTFFFLSFTTVVGVLFIYMFTVWTSRVTFLNCKCNVNAFYMYLSTIFTKYLDINHLYHVNLFAFISKNNITQHNGCFSKRFDGCTCCHLIV